MSPIQAIIRYFVLPILFLSFHSIHESQQADHSKFKTCQQSSSCQRNRNHQPFEQDWSLDPSSIKADGLDIIAHLSDLKNQKGNLLMTLSLTQNGAFRMKIDELNPKRHRFEPKEALNPTLKFNQLSVHERTSEDCTFVFGGKPGQSNNGEAQSVGQYKLIISYHPFQVTVLDPNGKTVVLVNSRGLMRFESHQELSEATANNQQMHDAPREAKAYDEAGRLIDPEASDDASSTEAPTTERPLEAQSYVETFSTFTDLRPYGPMSVGADIYFPNSDHIYGIPEHADSFNLQDTMPNLGDPYRLYNVDIFEYELNSRMSLYGAIPFVISHSKDVGSFGVFWLNPTETWIDIESNHSQSKSAGVVSMISSLVSSDKKMTGRFTHWFSETGLIDIWFMPGPAPSSVVGYNAEIFGTMPMPPVYSIGFHQCRWNYYSAEEVMQVDQGYDDADIPLDAIWLDVEYTAGRSKKYFTWDPIAFSNPVELANNLSAKNRRLVAIIDPHIKKEAGYDIYEEANALDHWVKDSTGQTSFEGWCWPGASYWPDFLSPKVRDWWASKFTPEYFPGAPNALVDIWNDMNEPSVFSGPEVTASRDLRHIDGWEHRDIHNLYGFLVTMATYEGMAKSRGQAGLDRPYILSRSFFAGSQRHASVWTGDNLASWDHLKITVPMLLTISISGLPFVGADVGGFFHNPESDELLVRWFQAGAFQPFFRAHAHHDSKRREAYLFQGQTRQLLRSAVRLRYSYGPYWYTLFFEAHVNGWPMMRPCWFHEPSDEKTFSLEYQYLLGYALLVRPVLDKGVNSVDVHLPGAAGQTAWFDLNSHTMLEGGQTIEMPVNLGTVPIFQRAGTIIPRQYRMRRSLELLMKDPITLDIVLGESEGKTHAHGFLFIDDMKKLVPDASSATLTDILYHDEYLHVRPSTAANVTYGSVERIVIYNWPVDKTIQSINVANEGESGINNMRPVSFRLEPARKDRTALLWIKKPQLSPYWRSWTLKIDTS